MVLRTLPLFISLIFSLPVLAAEAPWGSSQTMDVTYQPSRVVYDVKAHDKDEFNSVLDRVSYLNNIYHANPFETSIILVLHGDEIHLLAKPNYSANQEIATRAQSLTVGGTITIRMCRQAARSRGYEPEDIHGFVEVVPMADAEIVRLQHEGYAYMQ